MTANYPSLFFYPALVIRGETKYEVTREKSMGASLVRGLVVCSILLIFENKNAPDCQGHSP